MYLTIVITFSFFAILIFLGYYLGKKNIVSEKASDDLTAILLKILVPFSIVAAGNQKSDGSSLSTLLLTFVLVSAFYLVSNPVLYLFYKGIYKDKERAGRYSNLTVYANVGFIGFPLIAALLGEDALIYTVIFNLCYNLFFYSVGVKFFGYKASFLKVLTSPIMISAYIAITIFLSPFRFPPQAATIISNVGNATIPVSMFVIGIGLVGSNVKEWMKVKVGYLINIIRLIIMPLLFAIILKALHFSPAAVLPLTIMASLPIGSMNVIMAKNFGLDYNEANAILMQSMVLSIVTIPLVLIIAYNII